MIQTLFEDLIKIMREYVNAKKSHFEKLNEIKQHWEYSDLKKGELSAEQKEEFIALKEKFISRFANDIDS